MIKNKNLLLIIIVLIININYSFSQSSNIYELRESIEVTIISLEIRSSVVYNKNGDKMLIGVSLYRTNDSISHFSKLYDRRYDRAEKDSITLLKIFFPKKISFETYKFDELVNELSFLNVDMINSSTDFNIWDGNTYSLSFSGNGHSISLSTNTPELGTERRGLTKYLELCQKIWKFSE